MKIEEKIFNWAKTRGILTASPDAQLGRLTEEAGELAKAIRTNDEAGIIDGIGDMMVVVMNHYAIVNGYPLDCDYIKNTVPHYYTEAIKHKEQLAVIGVLNCVLENNHDGVIGGLQLLSALLLNKPLLFCLESAYNEIKDRKGMLINGSFVKESDFIKKGIDVDWENLNDEESERARILFLESK